MSLSQYVIGLTRYLLRLESLSDESVIEVVAEGEVGGHQTELGAGVIGEVHSVVPSPRTNRAVSEAGKRPWP